MEKKQTAVEWLMEQVNSDQYQNAFGQTYISIELVEQAKQMEKEQMFDFVNEYINECYYDFHGKREFIATSEQYYNETYGKNIDLSKISEMQFDGIDSKDYPDFANAYVSYAEYDGVEMTPEELEFLQQNYGEFVYNKLWNWIF